MRKPSTSDYITSALVLAAIVVLAMNIRTRLTPTKNTHAPYRYVPAWNSYSAAGHRRGAMTPKVTIVEFSDFECPACRELATVIQDILGRHPDVAHVYRHFPLESLHKHAAEAAVASECAGEQGRFFEMHDILYSRQADFGTVDWKSLAASAAVASMDSFARCMQLPKIKQRIDEDVDAARSLGTNGTPTLLVNDIMVQGTPSRAQLESLLARASQ